MKIHGITMYKIHTEKLNKIITPSIIALNEDQEINFTKVWKTSEIELSNIEEKNWEIEENTGRWKDCPYSRISKFNIVEMATWLRVI